MKSKAAQCVPEREGLKQSLPFVAMMHDRDWVTRTYKNFET